MIQMMTLMTAKHAAMARVRPTAYQRRWLKVGLGFIGSPRVIVGWGWWLAPAWCRGQPLGL